VKWRTASTARSPAKSFNVKALRKAR
jgi:hypothetical protein